MKTFVLHQQCCAFELSFWGESSLPFLTCNLTLVSPSTSISLHFVILTHYSIRDYSLP
jgi:hypothetical protein